MPEDPVDDLTPKAPPTVRDEQAALAYLDRMQYIRTLEESVRRSLISHFDTVKLDVRLDRDFPVRADAVFTQNIDGTSVTWAVEVRAFSFERPDDKFIESRVRAGLRSVWGGYQPIIDGGIVDKILLVTDTPLPARLAATIHRYRALTYATVSELDRLLEKLPQFLNEEIRPVPPQSAGPHFALDTSGKIGLLSASDQDNTGNYLDRIKVLLPLVRRVVDDLQSALKKGDAFSELSRTLAEYKTAINSDIGSIPWGLVYGLGVLLDNAATAANRGIADRILPSLEDVPLAALNSLLVLHGNLVLATSEGRELQEQADRLELNQQDQKAFQQEAKIFASELSKNEHLAQKDVVKVVLDAANSVGEGRYPERGSTFGISTVRNVGTVLISAAFLASLIPAGVAVGGLPAGAAAGSVSWIGFESLKKTKSYLSATQALGRGFDAMGDHGEYAIRQMADMLIGYAEFVADNEKLLRRVTFFIQSMKLFIPYIDQIINHMDRDEDDDASQSNKDVDHLP